MKTARIIRKKATLERRSSNGSIFEIDILELNFSSIFEPDLVINLLDAELSLFGQSLLAAYAVVVLNSYFIANHLNSKQNTFQFFI